MRHNLTIKLKIKISPNQYRLILAIVTVIFWLLIWSKVLVVKSDGWFSSCPNCWGDWMAHLTYTSSFAYASQWPLQLPVFWQHQFTYPFVIDLVSAGLVRSGLTLPQSLVWPGLILSLGLTYLVYLLAQTLTHNRPAAVLATGIFLLNGGWDNSRWLNVITSQLVPQRGILLGLSLSIIVYLLLWRKKVFPAGVIAGLLPLIHAHSYFVALVVGSFYGWRFLLPALALGLPQISLVYGFDSAKNFLAFDAFWLKQWLGLWPILLILVWGLLKSPKKLQRFSLPFWLIFLAANFLRFQPYDWDNTKLLIHWYLIASIGAALLLTRLKIIGLIIALFLIFPGIRDVSQIIKAEGKYQFFSNQQLAAAAAVRELLPKDALVLTASNHNHWLPALTGRQILMGYPGWLWTYGIDYLQRQADVEKIYQGNRVLNQYPIDYVVIGPDERQMWPELNEAYFKANFPLVLDQNGYKIFKVK